MSAPAVIIVPAEAYGAEHTQQDHTKCKSWQINRKYHPLS